MAKVDVRADVESFEAMTAQMMSRINQLGVAEAERRLGCTLEALLDRERGSLVEAVPGNGPMTVYLRPSKRMHDLLAALA